MISNKVYTILTGLILYKILLRYYSIVKPFLALDSYKYVNVNSVLDSVCTSNYTLWEVLLDVYRDREFKQLVNVSWVNLEDLDRS